jgi:hypothetical protein
MDAYLLAGLTEFWRAHRHFAAVLHFVYLSCSYPGVYTSDHFRDLESLILEPNFMEYVGESFKPLGVYLNFFQPTLKAGRSRSFRVMMINDEYQPAKGHLSISLENTQGKEITHSAIPFEIAPIGQMSYDLELKVPAGVSGDCILKAIAQPDGQNAADRTISRRKVFIGDR